MDRRKFLRNLFVAAVAPSIIKEIQIPAKVVAKPMGLYGMLQQGNIVTYSTLTIAQIEKTLEELFYNQANQMPRKRQVKIITWGGGMRMFNKAMREEALKYT